MACVDSSMINLVVSAYTLGHVATRHPFLEPSDCRHKPVLDDFATQHAYTNHIRFLGLVGDTNQTTTMNVSMYDSSGIHANTTGYECLNVSSRISLCSSSVKLTGLHGKSPIGLWFTVVHLLNVGRFLRFPGDPFPETVSPSASHPEPCYHCCDDCGLLRCDSHDAPMAFVPGHQPDWPPLMRLTLIKHMGMIGYG